MYWHSILAWALDCVCWFVLGVLMGWIGHLYFGSLIWELAQGLL